MAGYRPPRLLSVHGIRTHAAWQKMLSEVAADKNIKVVSFDYGYFNTAKFLFGPSRKKKLREFYDCYFRMLAENKGKIDLNDFRKRPSVVAHSFGTYLTGNCMLKYKEIVFDKVILCGSILPEDFDWSLLLGRDQVNCVLNECGHKDFWAGIANTFVPGTGKSGREGFKFRSSNFQQDHAPFEHSDALVRGHMEVAWMPFLTKPPSGLIVKNGRDFEDLQIFAKTLDDTHEIDLQYYTQYKHYGEVDIPRGLSLEWIKVNPDIYTFIFDRRDEGVKGYINAMPIDDASFQEMKESGDIRDNEIKASQVVPFHSDQRLKMYLMSIAIDPTTRRANQGLFQEPLEKLLWGFFDKLIWYAIDCRIRITELLAVGWSDEGKKLCDWFRMKPIMNDPFGNPVYWLKLDPTSLLKEKPIFPGLQRLLKTYQELDRKSPE